MRKSIMVPLDGSPFAEHAIRNAIGVARRLDQPLELVMAWEPKDIRTEMERRPISDPGPPGPERRYLNQVIERLGPSVNARARVVRGAAGDALVRHVAECGASLIVMTTRGNGGVARAILGSVADRVVRDAPVPVLLIKPPPTEAQLGAERRFKRVIIALDGSEMSEEAVEPAIAVAGTDGVTYHLVRVISGEADVPPDLGHQATSPDANEPVATNWPPRAQLERVAKRLRARGIDVSTRVLIERDVAAAITGFAYEIQARLISMTTRARRGTSRAMLGSVADTIMREAQCPVLLYYPVPGAPAGIAERVHNTEVATSK
ncbi:MAG TPA: universal stress protein [Gemmatimonadaceae bacterium]|nr:universal stress protein [Gemmatimonadaceae bacterium]